MFIPLNLTELQLNPMELQGSVSAEDLGINLHDELVHLDYALNYSLNVDWMDGAALVQGTVELPVDYECSRCLKRFTRSIILEGYALHLPLIGEDAAEVKDNCVDLTPYLREDILLGLPRHPLCRSDCPGLAKGEIEADTGDQSGDSGWSELDNLKFDKD